VARRLCQRSESLPLTAGKSDFEGRFQFTLKLEEWIDAGLMDVDIAAAVKHRV
jgi:hypothetical protein